MQLHAKFNQVPRLVIVYGVSTTSREKACGCFREDLHEDLHFHIELSFKIHVLAFLMGI